MSRAGQLQMAVRVGDPSTLPEYATAKEVSTVTRISLPTLARWRGAGEGPRFYRISTQIRYRRVDVIAWLESLEAAS